MAANPQHRTKEQFHHFIPVDTRKSHGNLGIHHPEFGSKIMPLASRLQRKEAIRLGKLV